VSAVDQTTFDLSVKNPNKGGEVALRSPKEILAEMKELDESSSKIFIKINNLI
jgi:type I restriction enzyme M protein